MSRIWAAIILLAGLSAAAFAADPAVVAARQQEAAQAMTKGDASAAVAIYNQLAGIQGLSSERQALVLNDRAVAQARLGQVKLAIEDFNRAVQLFPEHAPIYNNRGSLLFSVGLVREAVKDFDRAILLSPSYAAALNNRAAAHLNLGKPALAIADYSRAIELLPQAAAPLVGRGRAYLAQNLPHAAIRDFSRAVNVDERFAASYRSRAEAKIGVDRLEDAIEDLSRAIAFDAENAELYVLRGQAYLASANAIAAVKDLQRAVVLAPKLVAAHQSLGLAHAEAEAFDEALADVNRALVIDPRNAVTYAYRAYIYRRAKQAEIGQKDLQTALRISADAPEVLWVKAEFASDSGRASEAIVDLRRAVAAKPDLRAAHAALERLGAEASESQEVEIPHLGIAGWRVVAQGERFFARSEEVKKLKVPLEMMGSGQPKLLEWDVLKGEFRGIGTLRFSGGTMQGRNGPVVFEQIAIIDVSAASVVAIQPHRLGDKVSAWTWADGKVIVASVDGVKDEFVLRRAKVKEQVASAPARRVSRSDGNVDWAPWNNQFGSAGRRTERRASKPKSFFEMLFGN